MGARVRDYYSGLGFQLQWRWRKKTTESVAVSPLFLLALSSRFQIPKIGLDDWIRSNRDPKVDLCEIIKIFVGGKFIRGARSHHMGSTFGYGLGQRQR